MDNFRMGKSDVRILANAEPFGFGPAAALADFFPYLREKCSKLGYIGGGHTLDLQRPLAYDYIHDASGLPDDRIEQILRGLRSHFSIFFTALDFRMAKLARNAGYTVCIYDPLTWYWTGIPRIAKHCDLYIAQDFYGVRERIRNDAHRFSNVEVVPPIVPVTEPRRHRKDFALLNLGGLNNPYWTNGETSAYAKLVINAVAKIQEQMKIPLIAAANSALAEEFADFGVRNYPRHEMQTYLAEAKYALMTPGLGNIYDAARYDTPTIWLPPANDSQGQQLQLLIENDATDGQVNWEDIHTLPTNLNYTGHQSKILAKLSELLSRSDAGTETKLAEQLLPKCKLLGSRFHYGSRCSDLMLTFRSGGAERVANLVYSLSQR